MERAWVSASIALEKLGSRLGVELRPKPVHAGVVVDALAQMRRPPLSLGSLEPVVGRQLVDDPFDESAKLRRAGGCRGACQFVVERHQLFALRLVQAVRCLGETVGVLGADAPETELRCNGGHRPQRLGAPRRSLRLAG